MFKYFETELKVVRHDDIVIENAMVVVSMSTVKTDGNIEIPEKYLGCSIVGNMYDPETKEFYQVEPVQPESQLDRIEQGTTQLLTDIKAEAVDEYTLELMESGVI